MKSWKTAFEVIFLAASLPAQLTAIELQSDTLKAWGSYIRNADSCMQSRLDGSKPFLWSDEQPGRNARLRGGEILITPVNRRGTLSVTSGLIHDWLGAAFIPNATIGSLLSVLHDYDRYKDIYKPVVTESQALACNNTDQTFSMVWRRKVLLISAAVASQYQSRDFAVDARRGYTIVSTTQMQEIEGAGESGEHLLPPGQGSGFMWRMHSIVRYQQRDGGVYLELEAIALTRDIPFSLRWLVGPVVNHLSIGSLTTSLSQTREAVSSASVWSAEAKGPQHIGAFAECRTR